jgi:hypothetical protein
LKVHTIISVNLITHLPLGGHLALIDLLHAKGTRMGIVPLTYSLMRSNSVDVLCWAKQNVPEVFREENCAYRAAGDVGSLSSLQWLTENGYCNWKDPQTSISSFIGSSQVYEYMLEMSGSTPQVGHLIQVLNKTGERLELVKFLHEKYGLEFTPFMMHTAIARKLFDIAMFMHTNSATAKFPNHIALIAAQNCKVDLFQWCLSNGYSFDPQLDLTENLLTSILTADTTQKMKMLQCLYELDPKRFCSQFSTRGFRAPVHCFRWLTSIGITFSRYCINALILWPSHRALESIKYLVEELNLPFPTSAEMHYSFSGFTASAYWDVLVYAEDHWKQEEKVVVPKSTGCIVN